MIFDLNHYKDKLIEEAAVFVKKCTVPLLSADNARRPRHHGCGILLKTNTQTLIRSAKHVLTTEIDNLYVPVGHTISGISGGIYYTKSSIASESEEPVRYDFALLQLEEKSKEKLLGHYSCLSLHDLFLKEDMPDSTYLVYGNISKAKLDYRRNGIIPTQIRITTNLSDKDKIPEKYQEKRLISVNYNKKDKIKKDRKFGPAPRGLSGSGLWVIDPFYISGKDNPAKLAGIIVQYDSTVNILISVRVVLATMTIRDQNLL